MPWPQNPVVGSTVTATVRACCRPSGQVEEPLMCFILILGMLFVAEVAIPVRTAQDPYPISLSEMCWTYSPALSFLEKVHARSLNLLAKYKIVLQP